MNNKNIELGESFRIAMTMLQEEMPKLGLVELTNNTYNWQGLKHHPWEHVASGVGVSLCDRRAGDSWHKYTTGFMIRVRGPHYTDHIKPFVQRKDNTFDVPKLIQEVSDRIADGLQRKKTAYDQALVRAQNIPISERLNRYPIPEGVTITPSSEVACFLMEKFRRLGLK